MSRKIKSWDEASNVVNAGGNGRYRVESSVLSSGDDSIFGIGKNAGSWGTVVGGYERTGLFYANDGFAYPTCVTEECDENDESIGDDIWGYLLRYGEIITDDEMFTDTHQYVRIRLIACDGELYYHKIVSGETVECKIVGKATDGSNS